MDPRPYIVVVDDEPTQRQLLVDYLGRQNFRVVGAESGAALRKLVESEAPILVLLDIGLPGEDGIAVARWLRDTNARTGIIMVTAAADLVDRVVGLETGADDYMGKPFEPRELLARVKSVLRRLSNATPPATAVPAVTPPPSAAPARPRLGRWLFEADGRALVDPATGAQESLTASEFELLKVLVDNPNRPLHRDWLLEVVAHRETDAFDRAIDLRITRLRKKIEIDPAHPDVIRTVRGIGYMFVPPDD